MPKRQRSERHGNRAAKKQLYLIFDDWSFGYTIREVNLPSGPSQLSAVSGEVDEQRLPPPILRLMAARGLPRFFADGFGTCIILTHPQDNSVSMPSIEDPMPIFDVRKRSIAYGPPMAFLLRPIFFPIGDSKLYVLHSDGLALLPCSPWCPPPEDDEEDTEDEEDEEEGDDEEGEEEDKDEEAEEQAWEEDKEKVEWSWRMLPEPPFSSTEVVSYTVHPDGPSILLTKEDFLGNAATFTFHTKNLVWNKHGEWALPFTGRAHFDSDLGIFVGLSNDPKNLGHLCFFDKASLNTCNPDELCAPAWKLGQENLFSDNPGERHVSATLICLGRESKFCLVECIFFKDVRSDDQVAVEEGKDGPRHSCYMYRLTKFSIKYDRKQRDLKTKSRLVQYYKVPKKKSIEFITYPPVAFWL